MSRHAAQDEEVRQDIDDVRGLKLPIDTDNREARRHVEDEARLVVDGDVRLAGGEEARRRSASTAAGSDGPERV